MAATTAVMWGPRNLLSLERASRLLGKFGTPPSALFCFPRCRAVRCENGCRWDVRCENGCRWDVRCERDFIAFDCITGDMH